jgi:hypothetical protein
MWSFWRNTGQLPWSDAYREAECAELEELMKLEAAFTDWTVYLAKSTK